MGIIRVVQHQFSDNVRLFYTRRKELPPGVKDYSTPAALRAVSLFGTLPLVEGRGFTEALK